MSNVYLKVDNVAGSSTAAGYEECIKLDSWDWGMSRPMDGGGQTRRRGRGDVAVQELSVTFEADTSVTALMAMCSRGNTIKEMTLSVVDRVEDETVNNMTFALTNCMITSLTTQQGDGRPSIGLSVSFGSVAVVYLDESAGAESEFEWTRPDEV